MTRIIDLDTVAPPDIEVVHQDVVYLLPGDIPVPNMLAIERAAQDFFTTDEDEQEGDATARLVALQDEVLALFRIRQPDLDELPPLGLAQLMALVRGLYGDGDVAPDPPKPAPKRSRAGTTSTSRSRKRTASGSSRS